MEALESADSINDLIKQVKGAGMKVGIAIKPGTDVQLIESYCQDIDLVLIMTVEPGFGGQCN